MRVGLVAIHIINIQRSLKNWREFYHSQRKRTHPAKVVVKFRLDLGLSNSNHCANIFFKMVERLNRVLDRGKIRGRRRLSYVRLSLVIIHRAD